MVELTLRDRFASALAEENAKSDITSFEPAPEFSETPPQQFGPPKPNPMQERFQGYLEEQARETDQSTAIAMDAARVQNPKLYRKAQEISGLQDIPAGVVYRNIDQFEEREKLDRARNVLRTSPTLNDWFNHADNSKSVEVENLEAMGKLQWTLNAGPRAVSQGTGQMEVADIGWQQIFGQADKASVARADQLEATFTEDFGGQSWVGKGYTGALSNIPMLADIGGAAIKGAVVGGAIGGAAGSVVPGVGSVVGMTTGGGAGAGVGAFKRSMQINSGLAFREFSRVRDSNGKLVDQEIASGAALIAGGLIAGLDTASLGVLFKATGLGSLISKFGVNAGIKQALKDQTFARVAGAVGKRFAGAIGMETATEMVQEGIQIAAGEVMKIASAQKETDFVDILRAPGNQAYGDFKPVGFGAAAERVGEAGWSAFLATSFLAAVPAGGRLATDFSLAKQHTGDTPKIQALTDLAKADKLVKEDPAKAAELASATLQGTDKETVYLDTGTIREFMQEEDSPEMGVLSRVPGFQQKLTEATQSGADVAIPTADFYAYVAADPAASKVIDRLKFSPDGMSKKEAEAFIKALDSVKNELLPNEEPKGSVAVDIFDKTRKAGATPDQARQYASLYGAFFDSMAAQTGRNAYDIYSAYNLDIASAPTNPEPSTITGFKQEDYSNLDRIPSWKKLPPSGDTFGAQLSLVISPEGGIYNLPDSHDIWEMNTPKHEEAVKVSAYWDEEAQELEWAARFTPGTLTERQNRSILQAAAFSGIPPKDLVVVRLGRGDPAVAADPTNPYIIRKRHETDSEAGAEDFTWDYQKFISENPPVSSFEQGNEKTVRGAITFSPNQTTIQLFKNANLSTLLHETGHLFLQVMADLVQGKRTYGNTLFQTDSVKPGDWVNIHDEDGNTLNTAPVKVTAIVAGAGGKLQLTVQGGKGIYDLERVTIVSSSIVEKPEDLETEVPEPDESEAAPLPVGESPVEDPTALGSASSPEGISLEDSSYYEGKFGLIASTNNGFKGFIEGKPAETALQKRDLLFAYFPNSKEASTHRQRATAAAQNNDPVLTAAILAAGVTPRGGKKANPLGVQTEEVALLNIDDTISHVGSIIKATAKLEAALSGKQSKKIMTALNFSLRKMRKSEDVNATAWADLENQLQAIQNEGAFPEKVKKVVDEYINLYKKDQALRDAKATRQAEREGEQEAKRVEETRAEDLAAALTELSTVVERIEKIELQKEARQSLIDDFNVLQEWLGEKGPEFSTEAHEQFAVGFEAYLFEGVAPNAALLRVFDRFKTWLKLVYRKISNLGVRPTDEVRAVFGRMLTADQAIQNEMGPAFQPSFSSAEEMGVSQKEFEEYTARVNSLAEVGRQAAEKAIVGEASKLRTKEMTAKKAQWRKEIRGQLLERRVYRAISYLQGKALGGLASVKLDRARVIEIVGAKKLNTIPNGSSMWTKEGGAEPNTVAAMFGYNSGAEMLAEIQSVEPLKVAVEAEVSKRVTELADEDLVTPPEVAEMAAAKLRSGVYQDFLRQEIRTFSKLMGIDFSEAHVTQFKRMAEEIINNKTVRTILRRNFTKEYTEADRKIGKLLDAALKKKDYTEILDLRRKQLFNSFLIQKAYDAKTESNAAVKYLKSFSKSKASTIDQEYLSQIRNIAIGFNFIKGKIDETAKPFSRFLDEELDAGNMIVVDPRFKKQSNKIYLHLGHGELVALRDAVKNLDFVGRNVRSIFKEGKVFDLNLAVAQIAASIDANLIPRKGSKGINRRGSELISKGIDAFFSAHTKIEQLCDWMDGRAAQGPAHKFIFQPMADAQAREISLTKEYAQKILDILQGKKSGYWEDRFLVAEVGKEFSRSEMLATALNMGNESNLTKLKKGYNWTDEQLAAITERLDAQDWEIAQKIWDTIDGLWPMVLEVAQRTGIPRPDRVQPVSFTNKHGTFKGGYFPVVYDPSKSADVLARGLTTQAEQQFGFQPQSIFPPKSFASDRDNEYARPMYLSTTVLPQHIAKVVHYVSHAEAAYNVQKIMAHSQFKDRLLQNFGEAMFENMKGWIENITRGEVEVAGLGGANRFVRAIRRNVSLAALGFRVTTVVAQAGGLFSGAEMIGLSNVGRGLKDMYGSASISQIQQNMAFIASKSAEMKNRVQFFDADLADIAAMFSQKSVIQRVRDAALIPMMAADNVVSSAVWMGAYNKQLQRNIHDEATAVAYADKVVRLTQGAAGAKDLAPLQRGNEFMKIFTMFYTYFSAYQNRLMDIAHSIKYSTKDTPNIPGVDTPHDALRFLYLVVLPSVIFDFLLKGALTGDFTDDDEDTGTLGQALWKVAGYSMAGMIGVRDVASFVGKVGFDWKYGAPPIVRNMELMIGRASKIVKDAMNPNRDVKALDVVRSVVDVVGITTGIPLDAPSLILQNYLKAQEKDRDIGLTDFLVRK